MIAGRVWQRGRLVPLEIGVGEDGRIRSIGRSEDGGRRHDVGENVVLPAATDLHVHFRDPPGTPSVESIASGSIQAAIGGVGLVGDMPNTDPSVTTVERYREKAARVEGRAAVDLLLYAAPGDDRELPGLARVAGGFKIFLSPTSGIDRPVPSADLGPLLRKLGRTQLPVAVHAEEPAGFHLDRAPNDPRGWNRARPPAAEATAVDELLAAAPPGLRLHVAHVTSAEVAATLGSAGVSFEATPHHLLLTEASGADARFKVNPPLRGVADRDRLWEGFRTGRVPIVASDHAPHPIDTKSGAFADAPSGLPGVATMLPLLLEKVRSGELGLGTLLAAACDRPARWLGQPMGRIAVGHRANLLVVDFRARRTVRGRDLPGPCGWTAFEGREAIFPVEHWRDGERVVAGGEYVGRPSGRVVRPDYAPRPDGA